MPATAYQHIALDATGQPRIEGTRSRVIDIAMDHIAYKWDATAIQLQHPHLTLGQIHSALAYYHDHQPDLDRQIEERGRLTDEFFAQTPAPPVLAKLRALKRRSP